MAAIRFHMQKGAVEVVPSVFMRVAQLAVDGEKIDGYTGVRLQTVATAHHLLPRDRSLTCYILRGVNSQ